MDDGGDFVVDIKQTTSQPRESQVVTVSVAAAAPQAATPGEVVVAEISTTVDPHDSHDSHDSVTSSHDAPSHHDETTTDDPAAVDEAKPESTSADEPAHVVVVAETHDTATDATPDQQG